MPPRGKELTYAAAGVDRTLRAESKKALDILHRTYRFSRHGSVIELPYGNIFPLSGDMYLDFVIEEVGTKVLIAQLVDKYDTIGIDGVAMAVNDVIRSGARPLALADNIDAHVSDPVLVKDWMKGIVKGAEEAECIVPSGEIGDVPELVKGLVKGKGFNMFFASVGEVHSHDIIYGHSLKPGDAVIGLRSSGVHSNGITLVRKLLFRKWGGTYEPFDKPRGLGKELVYEALEPTRIYVKPVLKCAAACKIKATVHITGDAYLKFDKLMPVNSGVGFEFDTFKPQPIFHLIQETAKQQRNPISDEEMFKTFNMGWGFAIIVDKSDEDEALDSLERSDVEASHIGRITDSRKIIIKHRSRKISLSRD